MHEPLTGRLEQCLQGDRFAEVDEHLRICEECRAEWESMSRQSRLLQVLRAPREFDPDAGFYARVLSRIESQQVSIWKIFGESLFAKRLAVASLAFALLTGTVLVSSNMPSEMVNSAAPEVMLADTDYAQHLGSNPERDREVVLVNLASFGE